MKNKICFDKTHRIRPKKIEEGDWVLVYDSSLDNQHSIVHKFAERWFGPYIVNKVYDNFFFFLKDTTLVFFIFWLARRLQLTRSHVLLAVHSPSRGVLNGTSEIHARRLQLTRSHVLLAVHSPSGGVLNGTSEIHAQDDL